ncbi:MAG: hypothetical protein U0807_00975 [Candidatus Binatia bacterium]
MGRFAWTAPAAATDRLREILTEATARPAGPDWYDFPLTVRNLDPERTQAVIGYGSWYVDGLRKPASFVDVYLVVDDYDRFHRNAFHAWWNRTLPPNVYFVWTDGDGHREIRGKYNVISTADLERECSPALRDVYNAGRLTKLVWFAWVRDEPTRAWLVAQLVAAHRTLAPVALGLLPSRFHCDEFSLELLALSFRGEARLEGWERVRALHEAHREHYRALHGVLLAAFAGTTGLLEQAEPDVFVKRDRPEWRALADAAWSLLRRSRRRGYFRWPRIILTEPNLVDLAVSEAERKAGVRIRVTPELRRHPFVFGLPEFLRVLRERNTRERIRNP